jgi:hypothetical protein
VGAGAGSWALAAVVSMATAVITRTKALEIGAIPCRGFGGGGGSGSGDTDQNDRYMPFKIPSLSLWRSGREGEREIGVSFVA